MAINTNASPSIDPLVILLDIILIYQTNSSAGPHLSMYEALILPWHTLAQSIDVDTAAYIFMQLLFLSFQV